MAKTSARDAVLKRNTTGTTYVNIGQVLEIGDVGSERGLNDASAYGDAWKDYVLGQQDGSEFNMRVAYDAADAQQVALEADYAASTPKKFHLEVPPNTTGIEFTAIITSKVYRAPLEGVYEAEFGMKIVNPGVTTYTVT
jgi:hypothetical protein